MKAWRCWALLNRDPGVLASMLDPNPRVVEWAPGPFWQRPAWCAFHPHAAPDDGEACGRCGWRGQPDLAELIWWLADFKHVTPHVIGGVELGGRILRGDPKHPEIPGILRAELVAVTGPLIVAPGLATEGHPRALADRYGTRVRVSSARHPRSWMRSVPADLAEMMANGEGERRRRGEPIGQQ